VRKITDRIKLWLGLLNNPSSGQSKFIDLAPTDNADKAGVYSDALLYATSNPRVSNIALTGPYGSGKSSIIKSFLKKYRGDALQISLAAFLPESGTKVENASRQEIERSILQQMLYGADANKLPLSRFKKIQKPGGWSAAVSLYITIGIFACWRLAQKSADIVDGKYFVPIALSNWINYLCFFIGVLFVWTVLHHLYVATFGISLKSVSLKDIELAPAEDRSSTSANASFQIAMYAKF